MFYALGVCGTVAKGDTIKEVERKLRDAGYTKERMKKERIDIWREKPNGFIIAKVLSR